MTERAQALEAALRDIVEDLEARWDMSDPRTNPGIRDNVERARRLLAVQAPGPQAQVCDGCLCSGEACAAYRKAGKICCPDCDHMRRPQPDERGHLPTCSSWRCAWEWSTADGAGVCRLPRGSEIHYIGTVDSHAFMALPCDCVPAPVSPVEPAGASESPSEAGMKVAREVAKRLMTNSLGERCDRLAQLYQGFPIGGGWSFEGAAEQIAEVLETEGYIMDRVAEAQKRAAR